MPNKEYDSIIIGAGMYGLYAAMILGRKGQKVAVLEREDKPFMKASYVNQARVHNGYHYPRSFSTAVKSAGYFNRFCKDFEFAINDKFTKIYAIAENYSYTDAVEFKKFCKNVDISCTEVDKSKYFNSEKIEAAFETDEFSFDAWKIRDYFLSEIEKNKNTEIIYKSKINSIKQNGDKFEIGTKKNDTYSAPFVLNATYAGINEILEIAGFEKLNIKYEFCEVILCDITDNIKNVGLTVMDGPFFSLMPFGMQDIHSLTSVTFTPHQTSKTSVPEFRFRNIDSDQSSNEFLKNSFIQEGYPKSSWDYMYKLSKLFLNDEIDVFYKSSLYAIKPLLKQSELDDSRPTVIKTFSQNPTFVSVLSGKINTIYDLDEIL